MLAIDTTVPCWLIVTGARLTEMVPAEPGVWVSVTGTAPILPGTVTTWAVAPCATSGWLMGHMVMGAAGTAPVPAAMDTAGTETVARVVTPAPLADCLARRIWAFWSSRNSLVVVRSSTWGEGAWVRRF